MLVDFDILIVGELLVCHKILANLLVTIKFHSVKSVEIGEGSIPGT